MSILTRKFCSYKNCKSDNADPSCTETFFAFPRDEERYKLWVMLSRCNDKDNANLKKNQIKSIKYLCSKHFDHKKYMSWNPRRKLLLSKAIPYKYESDDDEDYEDDDYDDNYIIDDNHNNENSDNNNENEYEEEEILQVLQNSNEVIDETQSQELNYIKITDNDNMEYLENASSNSPVIVLEEQMIKIEKQQSPQQLDQHYQQIYDKRRKLKELKFSLRNKSKLVPDNDDNQQISTTSIERTKNTICTEGEEKQKEHNIDNGHNDDNGSGEFAILESQVYLITNENNVDEIANNDSHRDDDGNNLITNPFIITFMDKNEEYIKMPKSIYCKEKRQLLNEVKYYKDVITNFKKQLMNVKM